MVRLFFLAAAPAVAAAYGSSGSPRPTQQRAAVHSMGLFDGVKDAFGGDKPLVAADRVTPFDRWMGLDKALVEAESAVDESATYIDPNDPNNYFDVALPKPMGIAFVENDGEAGGVYVDQVLAEGSASSEGAPLAKGDQLVGVDTQVVVGSDFDAALDAIKAAAGARTTLTFFRGPTAFLYGPTAPSEEWYAALLSKAAASGAAEAAQAPAEAAAE